MEKIKIQNYFILILSSIQMEMYKLPSDPIYQII